MREQGKEGYGLAHAHSQNKPRDGDIHKGGICGGWGGRAGAIEGPGPPYKSNGPTIRA